MTSGTFDQLVKKGVQIIQRDPFSVMYLGINQAVAPLEKPEVRQAIEMAIDKEALIRKFFIDNTAQASQFVPPKLSGFNNNAPSLGYNPEKAKELLKKAGYKGEELKFYYPLNATRAYMPTPEKIYAELSRQLVLSASTSNRFPSIGKTATSSGSNRPVTAACTCSVGMAPTLTRTTSWDPCSANHAPSSATQTRKSSTR